VIKISFKLSLTLVLIVNLYGSVAGYANSIAPQNVQELFNLDHHFLTSLQGSQGSDLHQLLFHGPVNGVVYTKYLDQRITQAQIGDCNSAQAFACWRSDSPHTMIYPQASLASNPPQMMRIMVLAHEAKHAEPDQDHFAHVNCSAAVLYNLGVLVPIVGTHNCDNDLKGAYGTSLVLLKNIENFCANCTDKIKQDADLYSGASLASIDVDEERRAFFRDINTKLRKTPVPQKCTYALDKFGETACNAPNRYMLIINDRSAGFCFENLTDLTGAVTLDRYKGICI